MKMMEVVKIANLKQCLIDREIFSEELWNEIIKIFFLNDEKDKRKDKKIQFIITGM